MNIYPYLYTSLLLLVSWVTFSFVVKVIFTNSANQSKIILFRLVISGFVYHLIIFSWILTSYPLKQFMVYGWVEIIILTVYYLLTCFASGTSFLIFFIVYYLKKKDLGEKFLYLITLILFGLLVYIKAILLWLFYYAPNITFGLYWVFGAPSLSLALTPLARLYSYLGLSGSDSLFGVAILSHYVLMQSRFKSSKYIINCYYLCITIIFILLTVSSVVVPYSGPSSLSINLEPNKKVLVIGTNSGREKFPSKVEQVDSVLKNQRLKDFVGIFSPEGVGISEKTSFLVGSSTKLIYGDNTFIDEMYNSILILDKNGQVKVISGKRFLVPFGEYVPVVFSQLGKLLIGREDVERIGKVRNFYSKEGIVELDLEGVRVMAGLCSDLWSYEAIWFSGKFKNQTLFILESNTIFHSNPWFISNLYAWHRLHAYSSGVRIISVPNDSPIWIIDGRK